MPQEYDVKKVHLYIKDVMALTPRQRVLLWTDLAFGEPMDTSPTMVGRFDRLTPWEKANVLFRFGPIMDKIVREEASRFAKNARREDGENV